MIVKLIYIYLHSEQDMFLDSQSEYLKINARPYI
jgi:hypothetical protein